MATYFDFISLLSPHLWQLSPAVIGSIFKDVQPLAIGSISTELQPLAFRAK
jgi:hypothetical protein